MTRITLDFESLLSDGGVPPAEPDRLKSMAVTGRGISTLVQVLYILGALGLAGGVMILKPDPATGMALAALAILVVHTADRTDQAQIGQRSTPVHAAVLEPGRGRRANQAHPRDPAAHAAPVDHQRDPVPACHQRPHLARQVGLGPLGRGPWKGSDEQQVHRAG